MSTIMRDGKLRCDGTCHQATGTKCTCICRGKYHGANVRTDKLDERRAIEDIVLNKAIAEDHARTLRIIESSELPLDFSASA